MEQESNQAGEVKEVPQEKPSEVVSAPLPEKKETSRIEDTKEYRLMQSMKDRAEAQAQRVEKELEKLRREQEVRELEFRRKELDDAKDEPELQRIVRKRHELEDERKRFAEQKQRDEEAMTRKWSDAVRLAKEFKVDAGELLTTNSPEEMQLKAENLSLKAAKETPAEVEREPKPIPKPDSGISDAGSDSNESFLKRWNAGDLPPTKENLARVKKIIS